MSVADKIREMAELRDQGLISEAEFQAEKAKLLSSGNPSARRERAPIVNVNVNAIVTIQMVTKNGQLLCSCASLRRGLG